jgi:hypothetical protein
MTETLTLYNGAKVKGTDHHANEPCDYFVHPVFKVGQNSNYRTKLVEQFPFKSGGTSGTAILTVNTNFTITQL